MLQDVSLYHSPCDHKIHIQDNPEEGAKWVLDANEVRFSEDRQHISFNDFHLKLEPENSIFIELVGNSGDYDKASNEINLRGNLKGNTGNGYNIFTGHILYKQKDGYLKTDDLVEIKGPFFSVKGKGLFVNLANETIKIMKDVVTSIEGESLVL